MTICVAAMYTGGGLVLASDRMITAGDIQFQPSQQKIWKITTAIAVMVAGEVGIHAEIFNRIGPTINARIQAEPENWWLVSDVVKLYATAFLEIRRGAAERVILAPLGLTSDTFISRQGAMDPGLVKQLGTELVNFQGPGIEAIVVGVDSMGPHIFTMHGDNVVCRDPIGFAATGVGSWHANSQFMFAGHVPGTAFARALMTTFTAKKRAEVAPGVGSETDMVLLGPQLGAFITVRPEVIRDIDKMYRDAVRRGQRVAQKAEAKLNDYLEALRNAAGDPTAATQGAAKDANGGAPDPTPTAGGAIRPDASAN